MPIGDTLLIYSPLNGEPPVTNPCAFTVRNQHAVLGFDDTTQEYMVFTGIMPEHYSGFDVEFVLNWTCTTTYALTEAGDAGNYFATWSLTGISKSNTNDFMLYWNLTVSGTTYTVTLYKDVAKTLSVATGVRTGVGTLTLSEANSSGLSGSVIISGVPVTDTDAGNTLGANRVQWGLVIENDTNYDIDTDSWSTEKTVYDMAPTVGGTLKQVIIMFTAAELAALGTGLTKGSPFRFRVTRKSGVTPNITGDCQIKVIEIRES